MRVSPSTQELIAELKQLLPSLERLESLTGSVSQLASEPRQESLNHDLTGLQSHMAALESRLTDDVSNLEQTDQKWQTYNEKMAEFSGSLSEKTVMLDGLTESGRTPEEQFQLAQVSGQVSTGHKVAVDNIGLTLRMGLGHSHD